VVLAAVPAAATFTKITTGDIVTRPALYWNGAWGDYDDDGYLDLFVGSSSASTTNFLYHNNRDGTFTLIDAVAMPKSPSNQHGAAWGDYENDGHLDLITTGGNPGNFHNMLYHNNGDGTFAFTAGPIYAQTFTHGPSWADYDNDGFIDLFIAGHEPLNSLFHNQGDGSFERIIDIDNPVVSDSGSYAPRAFADYDNDGDLDLFVANFSGQKSFLYQNDGSGGFTSVTDIGLNNVGSTYSPSWGDYDNDGWLDLFLTNGKVLANNSLYHNEGDGTFSSVTDSVVVQDVVPSDAGGTSAWADYDNDGFIDLFVAVADFTFPVPSRTHSFLYHNNGDGTFTKVTEGSVVTDLTSGPSGASWGDYDNDGFLDLFVSQGALAPDPQTNLLYHNDGNGNAWLNVKLVGTVSNRSAIGAKVRVNAFYRGESRGQLRDISGGDANCNQQSLNAEFGLADATTIDTLRVEWPSGIVQELHDVAPRQFLTITELVPEPAALLQAMAALAALAALSHSCRRT
jgi:hypothetical protein